MMYKLSNEELEKLKLLDLLFAYMPIEELQQLAERDRTAAILKGVNVNTSVFTDMYTTMSHVENNLSAAVWRENCTYNSLKLLVEIMCSKELTDNGFSDTYNKLQMLSYSVNNR